MIIDRLRLHHLLAACLGVVLLLGARGEAWALGSTPVTVVNPGDIAKAEGIQHPFHLAFSCNFGGQPTCVPNAFPVPTNQRFVVEYVSGICFFSASGDGLTRVDVETNVGGAFVVHRLAIIDHFGVQGVVPFGQIVRVYADQGSSLFVSSTRNAFSPDASCEFSISGQAIDVP